MARRSSSNSKPRTSKTKYTALYVGSRPCYEVPSADDVTAAVRDIVRRETEAPSSTVPRRVTLTVSDKGIKLVSVPAPVQADVGGPRRRRGQKAEKVRHRLSDVIVVGRGIDADVRAAAALVLHGFDSDTASWLNIYVYWFDHGGPETAAQFVRHLSEMVDTPQHHDIVNQLVKEMIASGQLLSRSQTSPANFADGLRVNGCADDTNDKNLSRQRVSAAAAAGHRHPNVKIRRNRSDRARNAINEIDGCNWPLHEARASRVSCNDLTDCNYIMWPGAAECEQTLPVDGGRYGRLRQRPSSLAVPLPIASLTNELRERLTTGDPILLPPKDYDTLSRAHGNLSRVEERRWANWSLMGRDASSPYSVSADMRSPQTYL